MKTVSKDHSI